MVGTSPSRRPARRIARQALRVSSMVVKILKRFENENEICDFRLPISD